MIQDARFLRAGFVPSEVVHRDPEVNHLSSVLEPLARGETADTALITGPTGSGKTCIAKFTVKELRQENLDVDRVSCPISRPSVLGIRNSKWRSVGCSSAIQLNSSTLVQFMQSTQLGSINPSCSQHCRTFPTA